MKNVARVARTAGLTAGLSLALAPAAALAATPTATTSAADASTVTDRDATLSGVVVPNGVQTTYWFQWGKTTAYGHVTPTYAAGNAKGPAQVPVDVPLFGLKPNTKYHYRLVATGTAPTPIYGADQSFVTTPPLGLSFASARAHVTTLGKAQVKVKAVGPPDDTATGKLKLTATIDGRLTSLGIVRYAIDTGQTATLSVKLKAAARRALAAGQPLHVSARAKTKGNKQAAVRKLTLAG